MTTAPLLDLLLEVPANRAGGEAVAEAVRADPTRTAALVDALVFPDARVRLVAATAVDLIAEHDAALLEPFAAAVLDAAMEARGMPRYLLARTLPRLALTDANVAEAAAVLRHYLATERKSRAARAFAASGLARLSLRDPALREEAAAAIAAALMASPAERAQARLAQRLLGRL